MTPRGKVWIVGAGPGDPGLLTIRAREVIERAEVVVYDRLIGPGIAEYFPDDAEAIYVGKRIGMHVVEQDEIENILLREARRGKRVVRVKGGDPFLFGRGGEEAVALMRAGVDVEVVPGVSSAISVPAYAGIPVTHRGLSGGVYIVTAHRREEAETLDYGLLSKVGDTLVILMGARRIDEIVRGLVAAGKAPETPVAVIQNGTTAKMRSIEGTLSDIASLAAQEGIDAPAVIVVGPAVGMARELNWRALLPLSGVRVWLTESRKSERPAGLSLLLRDAGAEVAHVPCIATEPICKEPPAMDALARAAWFVFTSATGVAGFFKLLCAARRDVRSFGGVKIAAVGPATADALESRGVMVDYVPRTADGQSLAEGLAGQGLESGARVVLFRCAGAPPPWRAILEEAGAEVAQVELYRTRPTSSPVLKSVAPGDVAVFKSASAVDVFARAIDCDRSSVRAVCIGHPSASAATTRGFDVALAPGTDDEAIFRAILEIAGLDPTLAEGAKKNGARRP